MCLDTNKYLKETVKLLKAMSLKENVTLKPELKLPIPLKTIEDIHGFEEELKDRKVQLAFVSKQHNIMFLMTYILKEMIFKFTKNLQFFCMKGSV